LISLIAWELRIHGADPGPDSAILRHVPRLEVQPGRREAGWPAPRGMDRFALTVSGGGIEVDTGTVFEGPPIGTDTTGQSAEGAPCV
jgi:hypothetical protein